MKIEIWCEGVDLDGYHLTDTITVRVPADIGIIDSKACKEILERRQRRINKVNRYRREFNSQLRNQIERDIFGKKELKEKFYTNRIKGWTPIITTSALEFICGRF